MKKNIKIKKSQKLFAADGKGRELCNIKKI